MEGVIFIIYYIILLSLEGMAASTSCLQERCQASAYVRPVAKKREGKSFFHPWWSFSRSKEKVYEESLNNSRRTLSLGGQYRPRFASRVTVPEMEEEELKESDKSDFATSGVGASAQNEVLMQLGDPGGTPPLVETSMLEEEESFGFEVPPPNARGGESRPREKEEEERFDYKKETLNPEKLQAGSQEGEEGKLRHVASTKPLQILVVDDTNIDSFLKMPRSQKGVIQAIFVNSSFSHLTAKKWRIFRDKFSALDLSEVREIILKKQPAEARFLELLKNRAKELGHLNHLAFSGLVFDQKNMRRVQKILRELPYLSRLSFGQVELSRDTLMLFTRLISSRYQGLSRSELYYTEDELECGRFTYLGPFLKQSCAVKPTTEFMEWG